MRPLFESATIKLTAWNLTILMTISILFSVTIYQLATSEISARIENIQNRIEASPRLDLPRGFFGEIQSVQEREARHSIAAGLMYLNVFIFIAGGFGSFFLARRMLQPIEEAHEAQSRFVSDASHELRTPLSVMKVELETALRDSSLSKSEMRELLQSNLEEVDTLTTMTHTLLQLARLQESGIEMGSFDMIEVAGTVISRYDRLSKRIIFHKPKSLKIEGNQSSIEELMAILIDNALKYSPDDTKIDIKIKKHSKYARFTITNQGPGISDEDLPHIFNRFYRADSSRSHKTEGHGYGLGLSLAKKIVELHRGELSVTSTPGELTTFTVSLPLTQASRPLQHKA